MRREFGANVITRIFVNIETCPPNEIERELIRREIRREMNRKGELADEERIDSLVEEEFHLMALNGDHGRVLCIGVIVERGGKVIARRVFGYSKQTKKMIQDEYEILSGFWRLMDDFDPSRDLVVGHDIFDFDLLFLCRRSIIRRVRPTVDFCFVRYLSHPVYDTMRESEKWREKSIRLDDLATVLDLKTFKNADFDGSKIYDLLCAGQHSQIAESCFRNVVLTRQVYCRLNFLELSAGASA